MRALPQRFDDDGRHIGLGQPHDVRRQQPLDDQNAVLGNRLEAGRRSPRSRRMMLRPKSSTSSARWRKRLILERLEFLIPPLQHPANGRFGGQQRSSAARARTRPKQTGPAASCHARERCRRARQSNSDSMRRAD